MECLEILQHTGITLFVNCPTSSMYEKHRVWYLVWSLASPGFKVLVVRILLDLQSSPHWLLSSLCDGLYADIRIKKEKKECAVAELFLCCVSLCLVPPGSR